MSINRNLKTIFDANYLKKRMKFLDENIDNDYLELCIYEAQNIDLQEAIGTNLYLDYLDKLENNLITGSTLYSELDLHIENFLIYASIVRSIDLIAFKFTNSGIKTLKTDNTEKISPQEFQLLKSKYRNDYTIYKDRLNKYLSENGQDFEKYDTETELDEIAPEYRNNSMFGFDLNSDNRNIDKKRIDGDWTIL
jgi:hypothetical protein